MTVQLTNAPRQVKGLFYPRPKDSTGKIPLRSTVFGNRDWLIALSLGKTRIALILDDYYARCLRRFGGEINPLFYLVPKEEYDFAFERAMEIKDAAWKQRLNGISIEVHEVSDGDKEDSFELSYTNCHGYTLEAIKVISSESVDAITRC